MSAVVAKQIEDISSMIYEIRGVQVILDSDLAILYKCVNGTKDINKAVKRHMDRFPETFMFQLTNEEYNALRFQFGTSKIKGGRRYNPYVFTEQGIAMLSSVLHSEIAINTSIQIINTFVEMRKYIASNLQDSSNILINHENRLLKLEKTFDKMQEKAKLNTIFFEGQIYDAYSLLLDILSSAKKEIIIIDNYAGKELLDILKDIKVNIKIYSSNMNETLIKKYKSQYHNVEIIYNNAFHDRFIMIDKTLLYHCGSSFKDLGKKCFAINKVESLDILNQILKKINI